jgi:hypothetical protein
MSLIVFIVGYWGKGAGKIFYSSVVFYRGVSCHHGVEIGGDTGGCGRCAVKL